VYGCIASVVAVEVPERKYPYDGAMPLVSPVTEK